MPSGAATLHLFTTLLIHASVCNCEDIPSAYELGETSKLLIEIVLF